MNVVHVALPSKQTILNKIFFPYICKLSVESQKGISAVQSCSILRIRRELSLYNVYGDSALLVLNRTLYITNSMNTLLALNRENVLSLDLVAVS